MIDIHTHILPELDDGSRSIDESKKMLDMLSKQGVDTIVATPHFYIDDTEVDSFLQLRNASVKKLTDAIDEKSRPKLALGAEVQFIPEIYTMDDIEKLCFGGTRYMLVEMPFASWTGYTYKALEKMYTARGIKPIIAHVERYFEFQEEDVSDVLRRLKDAGVLIQINSSFLINNATKRLALKLVKKGFISFMGSDCHNVDVRTPELRAGFDVIYKKMGEIGLDSFAYWEEKLKGKLDTL